MKTWTMLGALFAAACTVCGAVYEAEDFPANAKNAPIRKDASASGGKCVELIGPRTDDPAKAAVAVQWKFNVVKPGLYDLRIRLFARDGGSDSMFVSLDGEKAQPVFLTRHKEWSTWERNKVALTSGEHTLILLVREQGLRADSLEVVATGAYSRASLERFPAPPVYPVKGEHPRVLLRKQDVAVIRARLDHPENAEIWKLVKKTAETPTIEKLDPAKHTSSCGLYSERVLRVIEAKAFVWLMEGDRAMGESAVKSMLGVFATTHFKKGFQDVTRQIGETIFVAGLVYDWCYPLMTPEQRAWVIARAEELCAQMEVGFPPIRQGNVTGHGGEAQIYRDLFCYGIAVYDESPEMYRITAGRVFSELTEARRFFYKSGRHHQGNAYGPYRYMWEIYGAWVVRRLCGMELYDRDAANMAYDWLYNRTPDAAMFQVGDNFLRDFSFMRFSPAAFYLYTWVRSPLAKAEFLLQDGTNWARNNAVIYLVMNEPDVMPAKIEDLPLTHYFPMPLASMTKTTATLLAVMKLYDQGKISLTERVSTYLPYLKGTDKQTITVRSLLYHESGLPASISFYREAIDNDSYDGNILSNRRDRLHTVQIAARDWVNPNYQYHDSLVSRQQSADYPLQIAEGLWLSPLFKEVYRTKIVEATLRSRTYRYSDVNFILLQQIVEQLTGMSLDQYVSREFYEPMGLQRTGYHPLQRIPKDEIVPTSQDKFLRKQLLQGYVHDEAAAFQGGVSGNAGLFSNATEVAKVYQMLLNGGELDGKRYLSESTCQLFTTSKSRISRRGLGFDKPDMVNKAKSPCADDAPATVYGHTGFTGTCVWVDPTNQIVYIFLSNRVHPYSWNPKLGQLNIRPRIQQAIYDAMK